MGNFVAGLYSSKLISKTVLDQMLTPATTRDGTSTIYGFGDFRGGPLSKNHGSQEAGHGGDQQGFSSVLYLLPERQFGVVVLSNLEGQQNAEGFIELSRKIYDVAAAGSGISEGHWEGELSHDGKTWKVHLDVKSNGKNPICLVDFADYGIYGVPFLFTVQSGKVRLERTQPSGSLISFEGQVTEETFSGQFTGLGVVSPFVLRRVSASPSVLQEEEVMFHDHDVTLAGTVILPGGPGPHPAIVCTHGSGLVGRDKASYRSNAYFFARLGFLTLFYDKRGVAKSTGDFQNASLEDLADDALAGVRLLKARGDVDGHRIGVMGVSQGGWVSPLAAMKSDTVAFVLVISPSGINPMKQSIFDVENALRNAGYLEDVINKASGLRQRLYAGVRSGVFDTNLAAEIDQVHNEPWFAVSSLPYPLASSVSDGERHFLLFEPIPVWEKVKVPVLALWGEDDQSVPALHSESLIRAALTRGENENATLKVFPHADHTLSVVRSKTDGWDFPRRVDGSTDLISNWMTTQGR